MTIVNVRLVFNMSLLKSTPPEFTGEVVRLGCHTIEGIGGGIYRHDTGDWSTVVSELNAATGYDKTVVGAEGGVVPLPQDPTGASGAWILDEQTDGLHVDHMGALGNGSDDTAAFNGAVILANHFNTTRILCNGGKEYRINNVRLPSHTLFVGGLGNHGTEYQANIYGFDDSLPCFYQDAEESGEASGYESDVGLIGIRTVHCTHGLKLRRVFNVTLEYVRLGGSVAGLYVEDWAERGVANDSEFSGLSSTGIGFQVVNTGVTGNYLDKWLFSNCRFSGVHGVHWDTQRAINGNTFLQPIFNGCLKECFVNVGNMQQLVIVNPVCEANGLAGGTALYTELALSATAGDTVITVAPFEATNIAVGHTIIISNAGASTSALETEVTAFDATSNTITLASPIEYATAVGARVSCAESLYSEFSFGNGTDITFQGGQIGSATTGFGGAIKWAVEGGKRIRFYDTASTQEVYDPAGYHSYVNTSQLRVMTKLFPNLTVQNNSLCMPRRDQKVPASIPSQYNGQGLDVYLNGSGANSTDSPYGAFSVRRSDLSKAKIFAVDSDSNRIGPETDNEFSGGTANRRYTEVFAVTGTINTSDAREKTEPVVLSAAEKSVAQALKPLIAKKWKWLDSVEKKGDSARWHFGPLAQDVIAAFEASGLNAMDYGCICYDEWEQETDIDEQGNQVVTRPAGNRYGIRATELLFFIMSQA